MGRDNIFLLTLLFTPAIAHAACPDGYTTYLGTVQDGVARNSSGVCAPLCEYGGTKLATNTGLRISLFADKTTFPAVHIELNGGICYADLAEGRATGALNVSFNDKIYHTTTNSSPCPETYTLSFDCGDGATGTPPGAMSVVYGDLYTAPYNAGGCRRPGYSLSGWKIDSTTFYKGEYKNYTYTTDKTMVAQWTSNSYAAPYLCNYCNYRATSYTSSEYVSANYGNTFTAKSSLSCTNPFSQTLDGYAVMDKWGNDTGDFVLPGAVTTWSWAGNVQLRAMWSGGQDPAEYTLSYDCGDGATGTPPESHSVVYGNLYTAPYNAGGCRRPGYSLSGWKIDSTTFYKGEYKSYAYTTDKTAVAQWTPNSYAAPYLCDYCYDKTAYGNTQYINANYNATFTPLAAPSCTNPLGMNLDGYAVMDKWGNDTGLVLPAGVATTWQWPENIRLRAKWSDGTVPAPTEYTLSYSCGDGATGTPPESHSVVYRQLYTAPYNAGGCRRPGYSLSGWKIDSTSLTKGQYRSYTYTADKTMVAQWTKNSYAAAYICNNGSTNSSYISATYGNSYTPSTTVCTAPTGTTFGGYAVHDAFGNDTGDVIASGAGFTWNYPYNIQLHAIWVTN